MFGSDYSRYPEILLASLTDMSADYRHYDRVPLRNLQSLYIHLFGVPEIGFQLRFIYFKRMLRRLRRGTFTKILDAGSGIGSYALWLASQFPKAEVTACDVDEEKLAFSRALAKEHGLSNLEFTCADVTRMTEPDSTFDLIVSIDVLEHIPNYRSALEGFHRLLKPDGYLYMHVPESNQKRIFSRFNEWHHEDHVREGFSRVQLNDELTGLGFHNLEVKGTFATPGRLAWELNHMALAKGAAIAALSFPLLYWIARLDPLFASEHTLATAVLAQRAR